MLSETMRDLMDLFQGYEAQREKYSTLFRQSGGKCKHFYNVAERARCERDLTSARINARAKYEYY